MATSMDKWTHYYLKGTAIPPGTQSNDEVYVKPNAFRQDPDAEREEWIRVLIAERRFLDEFMPTYHIVLAILLLVGTVWHWSKSWRQKARRREVLGRRDLASLKHDDNAKLKTKISSTVTGPSSGSSSCTTLSSDALFDERSPLVARGTSGPLRSYYHTVKCCARATLMYQPHPVPIVDKLLPSNATSLVVLCLLSVNVVYLLLKVRFSVPLIFLFSGRAGLLFTANLPWLYTLSAKNQPVKFLTGYSYESLNILHRRLGEWLCFLALLHGVGDFGAWYFFLQPRGLSFHWYIRIGVVIIGIGAFACYQLLYITSLGSFRQRWYELFLACHVLLQAAALGLMFYHHWRARSYVGAALIIFVLDRLVFRLFRNTTSALADFTVMEDGQTVLLSADWDVVRKPSIFRNDVCHGWEPMAHVFLTVPGLGRKFVFQAHPFTIASAAPGGDQHAWFNLIIRVRDGFTKDLLQFACNHQSGKIRLDGPYGSLHALHMLQDKDTAVVVAGGSGIAVAYPLIWALLHPPSVNRRQNSRLALVWVVHEASHISWIGMERLEELKDLGLRVVLPAPTKKTGRPDMPRLLRNVVEDLCGSREEDASIGVVVSGPDGMNRAVRNTCAQILYEGRDIDLSVEKFGW